MEALVVPNQSCPSFTSFLLPCSIHGMPKRQTRTRLKQNRASLPIISLSFSFSSSSSSSSSRIRAVQEGNAGQGDPLRDRRDDAVGKYSLGSLKQAVMLGTSRFSQEFHEEVREEIGVDLKEVYLSLAEYLEKKKHELAYFLHQTERRTGELASWISRNQVWERLSAWNRVELWKDIKSWDAQRFAACTVFVLIVIASFRGLYIIGTRPKMTKKMANLYMETVVPEPTVENIRKLRKALWRRKVQPGLRLQRYIPGTDGALHRDLSYIGDDLWEESADLHFQNGSPSPIEEQTEVTASGVIDQKEDGRAKMSWKERLVEWDKVLEKEELKDEQLAEESVFVIPVSIDEARKNLLNRKKEQVESMPSRAYLVTRKWWQYRPKLPYMFFLSKVEKGEVESAVYSEDTTKLFVRMKEGFPADYIVDIPLDPYLFDLLKNFNVKVDMIIQSEWAYYARAFLILAPSLIILLRIRTLMLSLLQETAEKIIDLLKMDRKHLILPEDAAQKAKSEYKDVVIGENVWKTLEEIMGYMREPMRYYDRGIRLPRGILISGPPGTGKTLLARAIARESGLPFVFASGAEFVESSSGDGPEKVFNIFFTARANAPSFIFIDEIDALAGKGVNDDPERRATFDQLLSELDGLPEDTDMDRFSKRQAVILICATNRPEELHDSFVRPGRIDREIHIGLPGEQGRLAIFSVHSAGRRLSKDVNFKQLVFRTVGYSGADIRNLINEAGIMAVRKGRVEICQQDFIDVLDKQLFEGLGMSMTDEEQARAEEKVSVETKRLLAVHEAGHVLLAHLFPRYDWHALTHLLPGGKESALSLFYPREETLSSGYTTVGYLKMQMVVAHGGRCAERLVLGDDITDGGQDDLMKISKIAREIAISHASPRLGLYPMLWKDKFDPPVPADQVDLIPNNWSRPGNRIANMTMELSEMFTREVTRYADETEEEAMRGLSVNRHILDALSEELFKRTKMSGLEISKLINSMNPVMLPDYLSDTPTESVPVVDGQPRNRGRYEELDIWQAPLHRC